jgi:hypothetical protein
LLNQPLTVISILREIPFLAAQCDRRIHLSLFVQATALARQAAFLLQHQTNFYNVISIFVFKSPALGMTMRGWFNAIFNVTMD